MIEDCCFMNQDGQMQDWETLDFNEKSDCMPLNGYELQYKPNADPNNPKLNPLQVV